MNSGTYFTPDYRAKIDWSLELKNGKPVFSASGEYESRSGQCLDSILKAYPDNDRVRDIHDIWKTWHLNYMNAGTLWHEKAGCDSNRDMQVNWDDLNEIQQKSLIQYQKDGDRSQLVFEGSIGYPCPVTGELYGHRWFHWDLPEEVIARIMEWDDTATVPEDAEDGDSLTDVFLRKWIRENEIEIYLKDARHPNSIMDGGRQYTLVIEVQGETLTFPFVTGGIEGDELRALWSVLKEYYDIDCYDDFEDFCAQLEFDSDSRKVHLSYEMMKRHRDLIDEKFPEEILTEELREAVYNA